MEKTTMTDILKSYFDILEMDIPEEDKLKALDAVKLSVEEKSTSIIKFCNKLDGDIYAIDREIARLMELKNSKQKKIDGLKNYLMHSMEALKLREVDTPIMNIKLVNNPPKMKILDESAIPVKFIRYEPQPDKKIIDKKQIKTDLKNGESYDFAVLQHSQRIKVK